MCDVFCTICCVSHFELRTHTLSRYRIFTHHGRTDEIETATKPGTRECRYLDNKADAEALYARILDEKIDPEKGYAVVIR